MEADSRPPYTSLEGQHWVSPAYLGWVLAGKAKNCEPEKTRDVRWFRYDELPHRFTITARNAIGAYRRRSGFHSVGTEASYAGPALRFSVNRSSSPLINVPARDGNA